MNLGNGLVCVCHRAKTQKQWQTHRVANPFSEAPSQSVRSRDILVRALQCLPAKELAGACVGLNNEITSRFFGR